MFGISLRRVSLDKVLQVAAVSFWNVTGVNLFPVADMGKKVLFLCVVCVDAVYLPCFQGVALFFLVISVVFHRVFIIYRLQQMYVLFTIGFWLEPAAKYSLASTPALSLPLGSSPWLFLLRGTCPKTDSGEVVVNSTLSVGFTICRVLRVRLFLVVGIVCRLIRTQGCRNTTK